MMDGLIIWPTLNGAALEADFIVMRQAIIKMEFINSPLIFHPLVLSLVNPLSP